MKNKVISAIVIIVLLVLDWAALYDLIKGNESNMSEYLILFISVLVFAVMLTFSLFRRGQKKTDIKNKED